MTGPLFPENYSKIWIRGRFITMAGVAVRGKLTLAPTVTGGGLVNRSLKLIMSAASFSADTDNDGYVALQVPATNDPDITPINFTYSVTTPIGQKFSIVVPYDTTPLNSVGDPLHGQPVIELIDVVPVGSSGGVGQLLRGIGIQSMVDNGAGGLLITYSDGATFTVAMPDTVVGPAGPVGPLGPIGPAGPVGPAGVLVDGQPADQIDIDSSPVGLADLADVTTTGAAPGKVLAAGTVSGGAVTAWKLADLGTGSIVYVDPTSGDDTRSGSAWHTAKATIPAAITALGSTGGTVELAAGTYNVSSTGRIDFSCTYTQGSATVTDTAITSADVGKYVISQFIPDVAVIAAVTPGVSFTMSDPSGLALTASGSGSTATMITSPAIVVPPGVRLRGRGSAWTNTTVVQGGDLDNWITDIKDSGTGCTILAGHPHQAPGSTGQTAWGIALEDFVVHGNANNQFGLVALNQWSFTVRNVYSMKHGTAGLLYSMNANANHFQHCRFSGNGYNNNRVTGGAVMLITSPQEPFGPVVFDNCFFVSNYGWGIVGTSNFTTAKGAWSTRVVQGQFNAALNSPLGGGVHARISGNQYRSCFEGCIFESAGFLDLDIYDNPVVAISSKFKATGGQNGTLPYTIRVNAGATFEAIGCGFEDATSYHVQVAAGATFNWRSCASPNGSTVLAADAGGVALAQQADVGLASGSTTTSRFQPLRPMPSAGQYFWTASTSGPGTSSTLGVGSLRLLPFVVTKTMAIDRLGVEVSTAGEAGAQFRIALYADSGGAYPGALVVDSGALAADTTGNKAATVAATLTPGIYWVGGVVQTVTTTQPTLRTISGTWQAPIPFAIGTAEPSTAQVAYGIVTGSITGALPTTFPAGQSISGSAPARVFGRAA